jgi:excisionase family DNA binding protein
MPTVSDDLEMLTPEEISRITRKSTRTVADWIRNGELQCVRFGWRSIMVRRVDFEDFVKRHTIPAKTEQPPIKLRISRKAAKEPEVLA